MKKKALKLKYLKIEDANTLSQRELEDCLHTLQVDSTNYYMLSPYEMRALEHDRGIIMSLLANK